ncbi:unnamed protein product [Orchesella dallaii]|uniref:Uncharacterized protein n=1 Tax=Orchesella dallaii TaxID=48710 RepID=A0ABP1RZ47_9HEXA
MFGYPGVGYRVPSQSRIHFLVCKFRTLAKNTWVCLRAVPAYPRAVAPISPTHYPSQYGPPASNYGAPAAQYSPPITSSPAQTPRQFTNTGAGISVEERSYAIVGTFCLKFFKCLPILIFVALSLSFWVLWIRAAYKFGLFS